MRSLIRCIELLSASSQLHINNIFSHFYSSNKNPPGSIEDNPFYRKYEEKLDIFQSPRFETDSKEVPNSTPSPASQHNYSGSVIRSEPKKSLDSILNTEDLLKRTAEEITLIWNSHHSNLDCIHGTLPSKSYTLMSTKGSLCPYFVYPLPSESDREYSFMFQEFSNDEFHFTTVQEYNLLKEHAPVYLTVSYYSELAKEKGIVLMVGKYDLEKLKTEEAQLLVQLLQLYYGQNKFERIQLIRKFNMTPKVFDYQELIDQIKALSLY